VVHIATEGPLGWSALRAARELGIPVSSEFRTNFHMYSAHYGIGWLQPTVTRYLRWFIAPGGSVRYMPLYGLHKKEGSVQQAFVASVARAMDTL